MAPTGGRTCPVHVPVLGIVQQAPTWLEDPAAGAGGSGDAQWETCRLPCQLELARPEGLGRGSRDFVNIDFDFSLWIPLINSTVEKISVIHGVTALILLGKQWTVWKGEVVSLNIC